MKVFLFFWLVLLRLDFAKRGNGISEIWNLVEVDSFFDLKKIEKDFPLVSDYLI